MASLVFAIIGCVPFVTSLLAVVLGILGIRKTGDPRFSGRGMAVAGLVLGLLGLLLWGVIGGVSYAVYVYGTPARDLAHQFASDLAAGDVAAAQKRCTDSISAEALAAAADRMKPWGTLQDTTMFAAPGGSADPDGFHAGGKAVFSSAGVVAYRVYVVKENGTLRVDGFEFQHGSDVVRGGTPPMTQRIAPRARTRPATRGASLLRPAA